MPATRPSPSPSPSPSATPKAGSSKGAASRPLPQKAFEQDSDDQSDLASIDDDEGQDDQDAPRYAQFVDEDQLDEQEQDYSDEEQDEDDNDDEQQQGAAAKWQERQIREQIKNIPFSTLVKARNQLSDDDNDDDDDDDDDEQDQDQDDIRLSDLSEDEFEADRRRLASRKSKSSRGDDQDDDCLERKRQEARERLKSLQSAASSSANPRPAWKDRQARQREDRERQQIESRANKHAPTEISSRKPVSRKRNVIETHTAKPKVRDPRFDSLSASALNPDLFAKSYSFLPDVYSGELDTLGQTLSKLKKQEANQAGPKAKSENAMRIRQERERVEAALRRAQGLAGERDRRQRETDLKRRLKRENKERVEKGLKPFFVKKCTLLVPSLCVSVLKRVQYTDFPPFQPNKKQCFSRKSTTSSLVPLCQKKGRHRRRRRRNESAGTAASRSKRHSNGAERRMQPRRSATCLLEWFPVSVVRRCPRGSVARTMLSRPRPRPCPLQPQQRQSRAVGPTRTSARGVVLQLETL